MGREDQEGTVEVSKSPTNVNPATRGRARRTSLRMSAEMLQDIESLGRAKYGQRGMSRWIEKCIANFMKKPDFVLRVGVGQAKMKFDQHKIFHLTPDAEEMLNEAVLRVRRADPAQENITAMVLRSAFQEAIREAAVAEPALLPSARAKVAPFSAEAISDKAPRMRRKAPAKKAIE